MPETDPLVAAERARCTAASRGWYEVYYVTVTLGNGRALWLRYTLLCPTAGEPSAALWAVAFEVGRPRWFAARTTLPASAWEPRASGGVDVGADAHVGPDGCRGAVRDGDGRSLRWDLRWVPDCAPLTFFPERLEAMAARATFPIAAVPFARGRASIEIDGERVDVDGIGLQQSHLFGGRHAHRWGWLHALGFDGDPDGFLIALWAVPERLGGHLPAVSTVMARLHGTVYRSRSLRALRWQDRGGDGVRFSGRAGALRLRGMVTAVNNRLCGVTYHEPTGATVWCANTEIADLRVVASVGSRAEEFSCTAACGFERGGRVPQSPIWRPL